MKKFTFAEINDLIVFDRKHFILIMLLFLSFVFLVLFKIHGYSFPMWHTYIDGSKQEEIIIGEAQAIRSDDWAVELPLMLSQERHNPKFPMVNQDIGNGSNMLTHSKNPISHFLTLFRPTVWGFFIGSDYGLSWMWQSMTFGLFYVFFLVLMLISKNDFILSILGSLFLVFSPFFQFFSFHMAEIPIFMGLIFISFSYIFFSKKRKIILLHATILGWELSCFAISFIYPPFQISCGYLLIFMLVGFFFQRFSDFNIKKYLPYRILGSIVGILFFIFVVCYYYFTAKDIINIMMNAVYPGKRFCTGGDYSITALFRQNFLSLLHLIASFSNINWGIFRNPCRIASFSFFFVPIVIAVLWQTLLKKNYDKFTLILVGYFVLVITYLLCGFPTAVSKFSFFYLMPGNRAIIGLGIANILLIVSFLKNIEPLSKVQRLVVSVFWGIALLIIEYKISMEFRQISFIYCIIVTIINSLISYFLLNIRLKKQILAVLVGIAMLSTLWFNPVVSGGTKFIYENQLSRKIIDIDKSIKGKSVWATFGLWVYPNLFRMLGVKSINGTHPYPQLDLWQKFDKNNKYLNEYNRFAHVTFKGTQAKGIKFHSPFPDQVIVSFNPASKISDYFGITHYLVIAEEEKYFKNSKRFKKIFTLNDKSIYMLK